MSIRDVFRAHGVSSAERAAEYVAFLLLIHQDWNHIRALRGGDLQNALVERSRVLSEQLWELNRYPNHLQLPNGEMRLLQTCWIKYKPLSKKHLSGTISSAIYDGRCSKKPVGHSTPHPIMLPI